MPDIATIRRFGLRSRIILIRSNPLVPFRKISTIATSKFEFSNAFNPARSAIGFDNLEMVHAQHDGDHRANVGLIVDDKNTGHEYTGMSGFWANPTSEFRGRSDTADIIPSVSKNAVTPAGCKRPA